MYLKRAPDNTVMIADSECHEFNFVKFKGEILLIDASNGIYKQITSIEDLTIDPLLDLPETMPNRELWEKTAVTDPENCEDENFHVRSVGTISDQLVASTSLEQEGKNVAASKPANDQNHKKPSY